ncbi:MAG: DUF2169 domain-containing protein [Polyangiaceae bacterium]
MKVIKPTAIGALLRPFEDADDAFLAIGALVLVDLASGAALPEMDLWSLVGRELSASDLDVGMVKPRGEVLVSGKAFAREGAVPFTRVRVQVGPVDKTLAVYGDRYWVGDEPSRPVPFEVLPIDYAHAYGGADYPLNPSGRGAHSVVVGGHAVHPLANIEAMGRPQYARNDATQVPAVLGGCDPSWPQRAAKLGTYDATWLRERAPGFPADLDLAYFNVAQPDQWLPGFFRGDEAFTIENMHPTAPTLSGALPGLALRALASRRGEAAGLLADIPMHLETVHFVPHAERAILVFRGLLQTIEDDADDVLEVMLALEALGEPRPLAHYQEVRRKRLDPELGHVHALRESDLLPEATRGGPRQKSDLEELLAGPRLVRENMKRGADRRAEARRQALAAELDEAGLGREGFEALLAPPTATQDELPDVEELAPFVEAQLARAAAAKADAEGRAVDARAELCAAMAEAGVPVGEQQSEAGGPSGPPAFTAHGERQRFEELAAMCRNMDAPSAELDAMLADPRLDRRLAQLEALARDGYRQMAHRQSAAPRLPGDAARQVREEVLTAHASGESLAARDLTGVDLSGLDLRGIRLRAAFLESTSFAGSNLAGADLRGAVLARADLRGAALRDADLEDANLGHADLTAADLTGAVLRGAVLHKADLSRAVLRQVDLTLADLSEVVLSDNDFEGAVAQLLTFLKTDLTGVRFAGADLSRCLFSECSLRQADFAGSQLVGATFVAVDACGASFRNARLENARFVQACSLEAADLCESDLRGANLRGVSAPGANLSRANAAGANLSSADLRGASLVGATLRSATLTRTVLAGADLTLADLMSAVMAKADLSGANLFQANLFRADMAKVLTDEHTSLEQANTAEARIIPRRHRAARS